MAKFDAAGAKLIAIGVGTPDKARILADGVSIYACFEMKAYWSQRGNRLIPSKSTHRDDTFLFL